MNNKHKITFEQEARKKILKGADTVADAVRATMGPKGRASLIKKGSPTFTRDGVTVAQSIKEIEGGVENLGAQLVKNVAQKTNDQAGDGTTTASVLIQSLLREGIKGVEMGLDPIIIKQSMEKAVNNVIDNMKKHRKEITTAEDLKNIATISSRDKEMGSMIAEAYNKIGKDGIVTTEEVREVMLDTEVVEGMEIDEGWVVPHLMTNRARGEAEVKNTVVVVTSQVLSTNEDIYSMLDLATKFDSKSLTVIAEDIKGQALQTLVLNKIQGRLNINLIKAPGFGDSKEEQLEDIAILTGANLISEKKGTRIDDIELNDFGRASKIVSYKDKSVIVGGKGSKKAIKQRAEELKARLEDAKSKSKYKYKNLQKRHARLTGGIAVIKVGAMTNEETREKMYRIEDAVNATRSALEEGIVSGGGTALYYASKELENTINKEDDPSVRYGYQMVLNACRRPLRQIVENAGLKPDLIEDKIKEKSCLSGFDAKNGSSIDDMIKEGIVDPFKVERVSLQNSSSVVGLALISNSVIVKEEDNNKDNKK